MRSKPNFTIPAVAALCFCSIGGPIPAYADLGDQLAKLLPEDGTEGDEFGHAVGISGAIGIVGAATNDDNGGNSGSAYLFDTATGRQSAKLLPDDGGGSHLFGWAVSIDGATAVVGAYLGEGNDVQSGSAYLFDTATGKQAFKLIAKDGANADLFGYSVAISGATAIVGAYKDDFVGGLDSGSAYLFDVTNGQQICKLVANDAAAHDFFGRAVAIGGPPGKEVAIVGAYQDDANGQDSGSAYVFDITTGQQIAKIVPDDGGAFNNFGISVAISGATAIFGAWSDNDNGNNSGSAYLFDISDPAKPTLIAKLLPSDGAAFDFFGFSVGISGATAIVASDGDDDNGDLSGSAYLFDAVTGLQIAKLLADDGEEGDFFSISVAISDTPETLTAIVGAALDDDNGTDSGSAYLFDASFCPWDVDGTGTVGASDLLALLVSWGPCKGDCPWDFDGSGDVGATDLLALLVNWGPCP